MVINYHDDQLPRNFMYYWTSIFFMTLKGVVTPKLRITGFTQPTPWTWKLLILFFSDHIEWLHFFQAGFIVLLFNEFRSTIITGIGYFLLTLFVQGWTLANRFKGQVFFFWPDGLYIFFVLHKFSKLLENTCLPL